MATEKNTTIPILIIGLGAVAIVGVLFLAPKDTATNGAINPSEVATDALEQMAANDVAVDANTAQLVAQTAGYEKCRKSCGANITNWFDTAQKRDECRRACYAKWYPTGNGGTPGNNVPVKTR